MFYRIIKIAAFIAVLFSLSCSTAKPEITYGFLQLVLYQGEAEIREHFTFFMLPHDEDGIENLDKFYLYHDKEQLRWEVTSSEWITHQDDGKTWIGTRGIAAEEGVMPRGVYRAVIVNKGGDSSERSFTFDADARFPFPELSVSGGSYTIISEWPENRLVFYDGAGLIISDIIVESLSGSVSSLRIPSNAAAAALWADDEANFCAAFTNMVPLN